MTRFLFTLSLGPVQSLIGAARRTRDLWCGSWLLSEAVRAAARELDAQQPGCLIFPNLGSSELAPQDRPKGEANISNILRAEVALPDAEAVRDLCQGAKSAAVKRLVELAEKARTDLKANLREEVWQKANLREEVWQAQVDRILEFYAAWVQLGDDYGEASRQLGRTLAARKATRDFAASPLVTGGLPKSSLDGALETVLPKWDKNHRARRQLRLSENEQLDALGVMKRMAGDSEQFTAYSRLAANPWIEESLDEEQQERLRQAYAPLVGMELATRVSGNNGIYGALPYDAQLLFSPRLDRAWAAATSDAERGRLEDLKACMRQVGKSAGVPVPYAAILKADGDRMGRFLSKAASVQQSRSISRALHDFASRVRKVVQDHRGHAIYAGGDDVLALVPLPQSVECAKKLADQFQASLAAVAQELKVVEADRPTLSVGLGIGHFMEPLGVLRARAEEAEELAKGNTTDNPRNALALILGIRSGGEHPVRVKWDDDDALGDLRALVEAFRCSKLPSRIAYDLRGIDRRLAWLRNDNGEDAKGMRGAEVRRLLDRARTNTGDKVADEHRELVERRVREEGLTTVADLLIVARWLSARTASEVGGR